MNEENYSIPMATDASQAYEQGVKDTLQRVKEAIEKCTYTTGGNLVSRCSLLKELGLDEL